MIFGATVLHLCDDGEALCRQYRQLGLGVRLADYPVVPVCSWCRGALR